MQKGALERPSRVPHNDHRSTSIPIKTPKGLAYSDDGNGAHLCVARSCGAARCQERDEVPYHNHRIHPQNVAQTGYDSYSSICGVIGKVPFHYCSK